jgi:predicted permease
MTIWQDVRFATRSILRTPAVSAATVFTLALGIGANTAVFSVVDAVLLRPLTFADPHRLVVLHETAPGMDKVPVGGTEFEQWRASAQSFERMALIAATPVIFTGSGEPERLEAARASASLFPILGTAPAYGRTFTADEEAPGRDRVVVLSDALWRRRFGADRSMVGRSITLNDQLFEVVGVLPPRFLFPRLEQIFVMGIGGGRPELWMPLAIGRAERSENSFAALAKLKPGVSAQQAAAELETIQQQIVRGLPNPPQLGAAVMSLQEQMTGASRDTLALLWAAISTVLLIACGNVTNLLLVRTAVRGHELTIRAALGAGGSRLLRHSLVDSLTLAVAGGAGGLLVAMWMLPVILQFAPPAIPRLDEVALDGRALLFALSVTFGTGAMVGLIPARRAARLNLVEGLRNGVRSSGSRRDRTLRGLMVTAQAALTVACLGAAGLVIQSLANVLGVERGFQSEQIVTIDLSLSPGRFATRDARAAFARGALQRLQQVPGVSSAGVVNRPPLSGTSLTTVLAAEGTEDAAIPLTERPQADVRSVDAGYFRTLGIPLLDGELFDERESRPVAIVSAAMARRAWPGENPIGKRFRLAAQPARLIEIVGLAGDVRNLGLETDPSLAVYLPYWQGFLGTISFVLKTAGAPEFAASAIRSAIAEIDRDVPVHSIRTMESVVNESVAGRAFQVTLLMLFGVLAIVLAGVGVFGVMADAVAQRSKELGIRLALGAPPSSLQRMVLSNALRLVGTGVIAGLPLTIAAGYALRDLLFGVGPQNPLVLASAAGLVVLVGIAAGWVPARRVLRIDPATTLRTER